MPKKDELYIEYMSLEILKKWPRNPKEHDLGEIHQSFKRFGYVNPIIIDERSGQMVVGHGRVDTLIQKKSLGEPPPKRIKKKGKDWLVPVIRGVRFDDKTEAEAYGIADNRISEIGGWNEGQLQDVLVDLADDQKLDGIGFDGDDLDRLIKKMETHIREEPEVEFTEELMESSNYIVLYFNNDIDWLQAQTLFELKTVKALDSRKGYQKQGIGRVVNGADALNKLMS